MPFWLKRTIIIVAAVFVAIQFIRPSRTNPPVNAGLVITSVQSVTPAAKSILDRSCSDCHSNRTVWPWYSQVAPSSWLVASDVNGARRKMNLSEWGTYPEYRRLDRMKGICDEVTRGNMPPWQFLLMHSAARLSPADVNALCQWTKASLPPAPAAPAPSS